MPRPDWRHMPASAWYGPAPARQDALFDPTGTDEGFDPTGTSEEDDFGTLPFQGCTAEELTPETLKMYVDR
ncbi:hypothetical protein [Kitasatospora cineracea]|uniref:hypothetical protein n=1 Tax=Kitasatospora cineracea TaxID=88074 RepID=UPI00340D31C3